jgi:RHS repeat-associated protein
VPPKTNPRGTSTIGFSHDPEHQRFQQTAPGGTTLYLGMAEKFTGSGGAVRWTNYLTAAGGLVGMHVENSDETVATRYFHKDHLGSIAVITDESGAVLERLSYDAWGKRRYPNGSDDPAGSIASQTSRGFTGHEELDSVGLVHMNGRVYDPLLARFGTPDPMTESPFSTQGWNRYSYVGNSPLNFTDPSGYCFLGCLFKSIFRAIGNFVRQNWGSLLQIAAGAICAPVGMGAVCAVAAATFVAGVTSGNLGMALRAGFITAITAAAFSFVGTATAGSFPAKIAGHAAVGCLSAVASGGKCKSGALATGISAAGTPFINQAFPYPLDNVGDLVGGTAASGLLGGFGSVAGGGKFENGATTAAFGYLFNNLTRARRVDPKMIGIEQKLGPRADGIRALGLGFGVGLGMLINAVSDWWGGDRAFSENKPSIVDDKGAQHILDGDEFGGGHRAGTGSPGKSEFPSEWSDGKILGEISDVATDPSSTRETQGSRTVSEGTRDGVEIRTVDDGGRIITGYPTNRPRNPR